MDQLRTNLYQWRRISLTYTYIMKVIVSRIYVFTLVIFYSVYETFVFCMDTFLNMCE